MFIVCKIGTDMSKGDVTFLCSNRGLQVKPSLCITLGNTSSLSPLPSSSVSECASVRVCMSP